MDQQTGRPGQPPRGTDDAPPASPAVDARAAAMGTGGGNSAIAAGRRAAAGPPGTGVTESDPTETGLLTENDRAASESGSSTGAAHSAIGHATPAKRRVTSVEVLCLLLLIAILARNRLQDAFDIPALRTGTTIFVAVCVQALPFLVLGVLISGAIAAFVPARVLRGALPKNTPAAVGVAGIAGVALPGCECASVPVARRLMGQGVVPAAALTFLLAAPAVNPVVLVATAVAFPGRPEMVFARFAGSFATAVVMGLLWARFGKLDWIVRRALQRLPPSEDHRWRTFTEIARADLVEAGGFLVLGALISAALNVFVPRSWFEVLGGNLVLGIFVLAVLAVVLALCSEADAFVAASLTALPLLPKLVFLIVGPAVDVKLFALQAGTFGRSFAVRFAPATFVVAVGCALAVGIPLIGSAR